MKRVLAVGIGLVLVLTVSWICCGNQFPVTRTQSKNSAPHFYEVPSQQAEPTPQATEEAVTPKPYSCVIAQALVNFDGPFMENGSQEEMIGVAALELWNTDVTPIEYVQVVVCQGQRQLRFEATYIPPNGKVLILEKDAQLYTTEPVTDFQCPTVIRMEQPKQPESVNIQESGICNLTITNLADQPLKCVRIFYKSFDAQSQMYIGGITYCLVLTDLQAGAERTLSPYHFAVDCSQIVAVVVEE